MSDSTVLIKVVFLFAPVPGTPDLTFVEVENLEGQSLSAGNWSVRDDGLHALSVTIAVSGGGEAALPAHWRLSKAYAQDGAERWTAFIAANYGEESPWFATKLEAIEYARSGGVLPRSGA